MRHHQSLTHHHLTCHHDYNDNNNNNNQNGDNDDNVDDRNEYHPQQQQQQQQQHDNVDDDHSVNSADVAFYEMLGIPYHDNDKKKVMMNMNHHDDNDHDDHHGDETWLYPCYYDTIDAFMKCWENHRIHLSTTLWQHYHHHHHGKDHGQNDDDDPMLTRICYQIPSEFSISSTLLRRITNELLYHEIYTKNPAILRTYETITKYHTITQRITYERVLTRIEHICPYHHDWYWICHDYIPSLLSILSSSSSSSESESSCRWHLYKEKLNIKPPGGQGYAPHVDTPSLQSIFYHHHNNNNKKQPQQQPHDDDDDQENHHDDDDMIMRKVVIVSSPQHFITVMIAIDDMTMANGCLQVDDHYDWDKEMIRPYLILPTGDNPDGDGRWGALRHDHDDNKIFSYRNVICPGGTIFIFHGHVPHRSEPNKTYFSRRAIFLTYYYRDENNDNAPKLDDNINYYDYYYEQMDQLRTTYRQQQQQQHDQPLPKQKSISSSSWHDSNDHGVAVEYMALSTIPKI